MRVPRMAASFYFRGPSTLQSTILRAAAKASPALRMASLRPAAARPRHRSSRRIRLTGEVEFVEIKGFRLEDHSALSHAASKFAIAASWLATFCERMSHCSLFLSGRSLLTFWSRYYADHFAVANARGSIWSLYEDKQMRKLLSAVILGYTVIGVAPVHAGGCNIGILAPLTLDAAPTIATATTAAAPMNTTDRALARRLLRRLRPIACGGLRPMLGSRHAPRTVMIWVYAGRPATDFSAEPT